MLDCLIKLLFKINKVIKPIVKNFINADAIIIGRTNAPAFSLRWFTNNEFHGRTLNPRNFLITPGGSSGGASAAVAAGILRGAKIVRVHDVKQIRKVAKIVDLIRVA